MATLVLPLSNSSHSAKLVPIVGFGSIAMTVVLIAGMFLYVHKNRLGGTMTAISRDFPQSSRPKPCRLHVSVTGQGTGHG